jgi:hypothetical protein
MISIGEPYVLHQMILKPFSALSGLFIRPDNETNPWEKQASFFYIYTKLNNTHNKRERELDGWIQKHNMPSSGSD